MTTRRVFLVVVGIVSMVVGALSVPPQRAHAEGREDYEIGPEDVLDIAVWNNTAISRTVPVRPDGKISLPLLNDVQAAGFTPMLLRNVLIKKLAEYMPTPEVSIIVREVRSFKVSIIVREVRSFKVAIIGEIKTPGRYEFRSRTTVLDALAQAGAVVRLLNS